jgi:hypothetical protein
LREVLEEWTKTIGFDRPIASRMQEIEGRSLKVKEMNVEWSVSLREMAKKKDRKQCRY